MARIRTVKPEFWTDSKTGTLSGLATKLFLGILNHCDDYGVIGVDLMEFKAKILPYESGDYASTITPLLFDELLPRGLLTLFHYSDEDGGTLQQYLYVTNFQKHQRIDKPGSPLISKWLKTDTLDTFLGRIVECSENVTVTFAPERKGEEGKGVERNTPPNPLKEGEPKKRKRRSRTETLAPYPAEVGILVNQLAERWPAKQPGDNKPITVDFPKLAERIDALLKEPNVTGELLDKAAGIYLAEPKRYYKHPQFFFGAANGESANWITYARMIVHEEAKNA